MVKQYETTFIVDAHLQTEQIENAVSKYTQLIENASGTIKLIDRWGKRRLAYEIAKKQYGYYVYIRFEASGEIVDTLEKEFKLDEKILRHLVLRLPKVLLREEAKKPAVKAEEASVVEEAEVASPVKEEPKVEQAAPEEETAEPTTEVSEGSTSGPETPEEKKTAEDA